MAAADDGGKATSRVSGVRTTTSSSVFVPSETFVSNHVTYVFEIIVDLVINFLLANIGIVSNILVIIVYYKQGFKKSVNISMTTIALWDLVKCLASCAQRLSGPLSLISVATAVSWENVSTPSLLYLMTFTSYVSSALAAYVALERCLCVAMPFSVSSLLTPKVTLVVMVSLSVVVFGCFVVIFAIYDILWIYSPAFNETIIVYRYSDFYDTHKGALMQYYNLVGISWPTASFVVIVVCTCVIVVKLRESSNFRAGELTEQPGNLSGRDKQVVRMLLCIIIVYIICLFPRVVLYFAKYFIYEFYFLKKYHNLFVLVCYWIIGLDLFNAAGNFFIFATMSSSFRKTLFEMFDMKGNAGKEKAIRT